MPAIHHIDNNNKLIITTWNGEPTASDLVDAFRNYQRDIKSKPEFIDYDEIVDFSGIEGFKLSADGLRMMGSIAANTDNPGKKSKLAIVVKSTLAFGLARMYEIYRSFNPQSNKAIRVFKYKSEALAWIAKQNNQA